MLRIYFTLALGFTSSFGLIHAVPNYNPSTQVSPSINMADIESKIYSEAHQRIETVWNQLQLNFDTKIVSNITHQINQTIYHSPKYQTMSTLIGRNDLNHKRQDAAALTQIVTTHAKVNVFSNSFKDQITENAIESVSDMIPIIAARAQAGQLSDSEIKALTEIAAARQVQGIEKVAAQHSRDCTPKLEAKVRDYYKSQLRSKMVSAGANFKKIFSSKKSDTNNDHESKSISLTQNDNTVNGTFNLTVVPKRHLLMKRDYEITKESLKVGAISFGVSALVVIVGAILSHFVPALFAPGAILSIIFGGAMIAGVVVGVHAFSLAVSALIIEAILRSVRQ